VDDDCRYVGAVVHVGYEGKGKIRDLADSGLAGEVGEVAIKCHL
jgi:hypothetical protein